MSGSTQLPPVALSRNVPHDVDVLVVGIAPGQSSDLLIGVPADVESPNVPTGAGRVSLLDWHGGKAQEGLFPPRTGEKA